MHQVSSDVSSLSGCLEFSPNLLQIYVTPSDVIPLAVSEVRPRNLMSLFLFSLGVTPSESIAFHLPFAYDETLRHIAICNDDYNLLHFHIVFCRNLQLMR